MKNLEIRDAIKKANIRYYEVAEVMGIHPCTLSHWLERELPEEKKKTVLDAIQLVNK